MLLLSQASSIIAASSSPSVSQSNTVAIVAIAVTGLVGVVSPIVTGIFLWRNTGRTIAAEEGRQGKALDEERKRLGDTLAAEEKRARTEAIRVVLDHGATLINRIQEMLGGLKAQGDKVEVPVGFEEMLSEATAFQGRLRLWFDDGSDIVTAFDDVLKTSIFTSELRDALESGQPLSVSVTDYQSLRRQFAEHSGDVLAHRKRYLDAARFHLRSSSP